ncbi:putative AcnD-accessory protein PrpF, partial [Vibrio parahaemolyticus V-223/04]
LRRRVYREH